VQVLPHVLDGVPPVAPPDMATTPSPVDPLRGRPLPPPIPPVARTTAPRPTVTPEPVRPAPRATDPDRIMTSALPATRNSGGASDDGPDLATLAAPLLGLGATKPAAPEPPPRRNSDPAFAPLPAPGPRAPNGPLPSPFDAIAPAAAPAAAPSPLPAPSALAGVAGGNQRQAAKRRLAVAGVALVTAAIITYYLLTLWPRG
jgi:hypothetical protein